MNLSAWLFIEREQMANFTVRPVLTKADTKKFIDFIYTFYNNDPNWVPPLRMDREKLIDKKKNPFYKHSLMELFLAERDGKVIGRIGAIVNDNHNREHNDKVGFFGFFECVNEQDVANALFDEAKKYLRSKGMNAMRGPASPSVNDEYGLLIEGFDSPPVVLMTYNPEYYGTLIQNYGLKKEKDLYAYIMDQHTVYTDKFNRANEIVKQRNSLTFRTINMKDFANEVRRIKDVYNGAWQYNWGAVAMTDEEFDALANDLKMVVEPELVLIAESKGKMVGFGLSLPDINVRLKENRNGGLIGGLLRLLVFKKKVDLVRVIVLGVLPEYQKTGAAGVLFYETAIRAKKLGYRYGEASWILEDNVMMNRAAEAMQGKIYKKYRIYQQEI
jgi:GNAT superfamily N-acetyltransferase